MPYRAAHCNAERRVGTGELHDVAQWEHCRPLRSCQLQWGKWVWSASIVEPYCTVRKAPYRVVFLNDLFESLRLSCTR